MLPSNFGETLVFWNPKFWCFEIPCQVDKVACRTWAQILDVTIPCFDLPNFWSELASAELWFVESAYRVCITDAHNPDVNSSTLNQRPYQTFDVIKSIANECVREKQGCVEINTNFGDVMDSCNSKTIEQRLSDSVRRLSAIRECKKGHDRTQTRFH